MRSCIGRPTTSCSTSTERCFTKMWRAPLWTCWSPSPRRSSTRPTRKCSRRPLRSGIGRSMSLSWSKTFFCTWIKTSFPRWEIYWLWSKCRRLSSRPPWSRIQPSRKKWCLCFSCRSRKSATAKWLSEAPSRSACKCWSKWGWTAKESTSRSSNLFWSRKPGTTIATSPTRWSARILRTLTLSRPTSVSKKSKTESTATLMFLPSKRSSTSFWRSTLRTTPRPFSKWRTQVLPSWSRKESSLRSLLCSVSSKSAPTP